MTKTQHNRLKKLIRHLRGPASNRFHQKFDFSCVSVQPKAGTKNVCGSAGGAIGEMPYLWSRKFKWVPAYEDSTNTYFFVRPKGHGDGGGSWRHIEAMSDFFGIPVADVRTLFYPDAAELRASYNATAKEVADQLDDYLTNL
jgi:hypothetical protein